MRFHGAARSGKRKASGFVLFLRDNGGGLPIMLRPAFWKPRQTATGNPRINRVAKSVAKHAHFGSLPKECICG